MMIMSMLDLDWAWSVRQWYAFGGVTLAGLGAIGLLTIAVRTVRGWTAPATYRDPGLAHVRPRPSLELTERRMVSSPPGPFAGTRFAVSSVVPPDDRTYAWMTDRPDEVQRLIPVIDPTGEVLEHMAPGPGSLTSLAAAGPGSLTRAELVEPEVRDGFAFTFDRPAYAPARHEAGVRDEGGVFARFEAAIGPAMATAAQWLAQGRTPAQQALDEWRIYSPTGEMPIIDLPSTGRYAEALLAA